MQVRNDGFIWNALYAYAICSDFIASKICMEAMLYTIIFLFRGIQKMLWTILHYQNIFNN